MKEAATPAASFMGTLDCPTIFPLRSSGRPLNGLPVDKKTSEARLMNTASAATEQASEVQPKTDPTPTKAYDRPLEYNSQRETLFLAEYGRHVQDLVSHLLTIEDRNERTRAAYRVVEIMEQLNPQVKEQPEYRHKLWDHLYIISRHQLEVDSPYPKPQQTVLDTPPERMTYPQHNIQIRYYGYYIQQLAEKAAELEDGPDKQRLVDLLGSYMKQTYRLFNKDKVADETIVQHMSQLTNGKLKVEGFQTVNKNTPPDPQKGFQKGGSSKSKKGKRGGR